MVGVPKSTGCFVCRKRKIKCDETWPTCTNCTKNGKTCPGPPARHTFRDLNSRLNYKTANVVVEGVSPPSDQVSRRLKQVNEIYEENGSVRLKFRISQRETGPPKRSARRSNSTSLSPPKSPFLRHPSPTQHHELARALIAATMTGGAGHRMSVFGPFIREVPARVGHNAALDAAVAVLVHTHTSLILKKSANEIVSPQLYLRAIKTLQTCLEDPLQGMAANTLCASVLLGLVEALAGPREGNRYLTHVGGAGRLMELQGPGAYRDSFAKEILRFSRGGVIVTSVYERRPCFLAAPGWREITFDKTGLGFDDCLHTDLMQCMADLPEVFHDLKELNNQFARGQTHTPGIHPETRGVIDQTLANTYPPPDFSSNDIGSLDFLNDLQSADNPYLEPAASLHSSARMVLLNKVQKLKDALRTLGMDMHAKLVNGTTAFEMPTIEESNPVSTTYHFNNWRDMTAYNTFWSVLILTNKAMIRLLRPYDPVIYDLQSECRIVALEICKTWEDAWTNKPIGTFHTGLSFVVAFEFCVPDVQEWIVKRLNSLLDYQMVDAFRWDDEVIAMMSSKLAGEGSDVVFSSVNLSEETQ